MVLHFVNFRIIILFFQQKIFSDRLFPVICHGYGVKVSFEYGVFESIFTSGGDIREKPVFSDFFKKFQRLQFLTDFRSVCTNRTGRLVRTKNGKVQNDPPTPTPANRKKHVFSLES